MKADVHTIKLELSPAELTNVYQLVARGMQFYQMEDMMKVRGIPSNIAAKRLEFGASFLSTIEGCNERLIKEDA